MKTFVHSLLFVATLLSVMGFVDRVSRAEDMKFTIVSYMTKAESIPVTDAEGHALLLGERRGVATFEDGRVAAYHTRFICDLTQMIGPCEGYSDLTFMDQSQTFSKYKLNLEIAEGKPVPIMKGTGSFIKGTGKYEGVEGDFSFAGYPVTPYNEETKGDQVVKVSGSYKLPE